MNNTHESQFANLQCLPADIYGVLVDRLSQIDMALRANPNSVSLHIQKALACLFIDDWRTAFAEYCLIVVLDGAGTHFQTERSILQLHIQDYVQTQSTRKDFDIRVDLPLHIWKCGDYLDDKDDLGDDYIDESDVDWDALNAFYGQTSATVDNGLSPAKAEANRTQS